MTDTNVFRLSQPGTFTDPLTEVLRSGARALLAQAVEAEVSSLLSWHADKLTDDGRRRLVRHGHLPEREIMTSIGSVAVRCPRVPWVIDGEALAGPGMKDVRFRKPLVDQLLYPFPRDAIPLAAPPVVFSPSQPVHSGSGILLEFEERLPEQLDGDMVEERGELLLLPVPCHLPYAVQRL